MTLRHAIRTATLLLMVAQVTGTTLAQAPKPGSFATEEDANRSRERLLAIFQQYPPSLRQVLQIDPLLLSNKDYMSMYPALADFLRQHPEVAHNPAYFVGTPVERVPFAQNPNGQVAREVMEPIGVFLVVGTISIVFLLLVRTLADYRRQNRSLKTQAEVHTKLLDRFSGNEDLLAYIQSPAGRNFLESSPAAAGSAPQIVAAPIGRILWSIQVGLVVAFAGLGLHYAMQSIAERFGTEVVSVISTLAVFVGIGFIVSAAVSYGIARHLGLLAVQQPGDKREAPTQS